jgi:hypothetical protein
MRTVSLGLQKFTSKIGLNSSIRCHRRRDEEAVHSCSLSSCLDGHKSAGS